MILVHLYQNALSIVNGDDTGIEEPIKELCPCLPREVCPHNHALSTLVSNCDKIIFSAFFGCHKDHSLEYFMAIGPCRPNTLTINDFKFIFLNSIVSDES